MPSKKKNHNMKTPLNPVAHILIEDIESFEEPGSISANVQAPALHTQIITDTHHPESEFVIRFETDEDEHEVEELALNLLHVENPQPEPPYNDLTLDTHEVISQLDEAPVVLSASRPQKTYALSPVDDMIAVENIVLDLQDSMEELELAPFTQEEEGISEPLLTLDDLLDDIAIQEELRDLDEETPRPATLKKAKVKKERIKLQLPVGWAKTLAVFVGLSFGVIIPLRAMTSVNAIGTAQDAIMDSGSAAVGSLTNAAASAAEQDFNHASAEFDAAAASFGMAQDHLERVNRDLLGIADLLPQTSRQVKTARALLSAGESSSNAASTLVEGMSTIANRSDDSPSAAVSLFDVFVENALPDLQRAEAQLAEVSIAAIPAEHRSTVRKTKSAIGGITAALTTFHDSADAIQALLGHNQRQRYLIMFQNNTELRPTGGFWGSFAEVDILDGKVTNISVPGGGTYDLQGQLTEFVAAPEPMRLLNGRWEFQDANWFPDFPTSAKKAMWFYEKSAGPSVDGVIAVNATLVSELIDATGPISLPEYGKTIDGENFLFETQKQVEVDYDIEENQPKAFIGDMASVLIDRLTETEGVAFIEISNLLSEGLSGRDIQMYHSDPDIQSAILKLGWDGSVLGNEGDYFMLVHTNLGGGKTDGVIDDEVVINSRLRKDGRIENTATVTRTHHGLKTALFSGANNVSFSRIFVPRGSELLSVDGATPPDSKLFESVNHLNKDSLLERTESTEVNEKTGTVVSESFGKTSFGQWIQTSPGTSSTLTFTYLLPEEIIEMPSEGFWAKTGSFVGLPQTVEHSIMIQKQPGVEFRTTSYSFDSGETLRPVWSSQDTVEQLHIEQNNDGFFGMIFEAK